MSDEEEYNPNNENDKGSSDEEIEFETDRTSHDEENRFSRRRSPIWKYFSVLQNHRALCKLCGVTISYRSTISNLGQHMQRRHPRCYREYLNSRTKIDVPVFNKDTYGLRPKVQHWDILSRWFKESEPGFSNCRICDYFVNNVGCHTHLMKHPTHYSTYKKLAGKMKSQIKEENDASSSIVGDTEKNTDNDNIIIEHIEMDGTVGNLTSSWDFFKKLDSESATCRLCDKTVLWSDDVTKLRKHLDEDHIGLELAEEEILEYTDTTNQLEGNLDSQHVNTEESRPKKRKKCSERSSFWKNNSLDKHVIDEQYEDSLERFGAYVTSLMKLLPRDLAAKYQVQIIERLVKETNNI